MKKIEEILKIEGACDSKHILNTSPHPVAQEILDQVERGCSLETLEQITKGYNIYKYTTQITIHGIFPDVSTKRIGSYVNLVQNKNKSIGVRYNAIDYSKKKRLFEILRLVDGWKIEYNSQKYAIYKMERLKSDKQDALKQVDSFKQQAERIDRSLFYGSVNVFVAQSIFGTYIVLELNVSAFYESNFERIVENICGISYAEVIAKRDSRLAEIKAESDRIDAELKMKQEAAEAERLRRAPIIEAARDAFLAEHPEIVRVEKHELKKGDVCFRLNVEFDKDTDTATISAQKYEIGQSFGRLIYRPVTESGKYKKGFAAKKYFTGYMQAEKNGSKLAVLSTSTAAGDKLPTTAIKRPVSAAKTPNKAGLNLQLIDYSLKAIALIGDTKSIKEDLKKLGGRFNPRLSCGAGWIFSAKKRSDLESLIARLP